jgi:WD40 repeat protein
MKKLTPLAILLNHTSSVHSLAFDPHNNSRIASGGKDKRIAIWSIY